MFVKQNYFRKFIKVLITFVIENNNDNTLLKERVFSENLFNGCSRWNICLICYSSCSFHEMIIAVERMRIISMFLFFHYIYSLSMTRVTPRKNDDNFHVSFFSLHVFLGTIQLQDHRYLCIVNDIESSAQRSKLNLKTLETKIKTNVQNSKWQIRMNLEDLDLKTSVLVNRISDEGSACGYSK